MNFRTISRSMRPPFLILPPVCVFLGVVSVIAAGEVVDYGLLALVLIGAIAAHVSVNMLNEYRDFSSGLDLHTQRTPFSGGSGALPQQPEQARSVFLVSILSLTITFLIGLFFLLRWGWPIVPIGLAGLFLIATYTDWINKNPLLCLIAPGLGFGYLMVLGTEFALTGQFSVEAILLASVVFFLVNNLLLLNQFPDIEADKDAGRYHLPIAYGTAVASRFYLGFVFAVIVLLVVAVSLDLLPAASLFALSVIPLSFLSYRGAVIHGAAIGEHPGYLAMNVIVTVMLPLLLGISLLIA